MKPNWEVIQADCVEAMRAMEPNSVDAIVTDPPYGLEFMGKEWDKLDNGADVRQPFRGEVQTPDNPYGTTPVRFGYDSSLASVQAWHFRWATEALRVLKPGGHLLAFGGTRTYHRLVCAVEDAGFEVRDTINWVYSTGFPKSYNVSRGIERGTLSAEEERFCTWMRDESGLTEARVREITGSGRFVSGEVEVVNTAPSNEKPRMARRAMVPTAAAWAKLRQAMSEVPPGWVEDLVKAAPMEFEDGLIPWRPGKGDGTAGKNEWAGWGTALKPAHEPIVVARKPLTGTVAENVQEYGTGALNVEATRVGLSPADPEREIGRMVRKLSGTDWFVNSPDKVGTRSPELSPAGRWPPNLMLTHSPECRRAGSRVVARHLVEHGDDQFPGPIFTNGSVGRGDTTEAIEAWSCIPGCPVAEMDRQSGFGADGTAVRRNVGHSAGGFGFASGSKDAEMVGDVTYGGEGTASRFFPQFGWDAEMAEEASFSYEPKASRSEREAGCENVPEVNFGQSGGAQQALESGLSEYIQEGNIGLNRIKKVHNNHPTVKPIALLRWLIRLVTPPGGRVLDPFAGSGSAGCAAALEGAEYIGIEKEPAYCEIARSRIHYWASPRPVTEEIPGGRPRGRERTLSDWAEG